MLSRAPLGPFGVWSPCLSLGFSLVRAVVVSSHWSSLSALSLSLSFSCPFCLSCSPLRALSFALFFSRARRPIVFDPPSPSSPAPPPPLSLRLALLLWRLRACWGVRALFRSLAHGPAFTRASRDRGTGWLGGPAPHPGSLPDIGLSFLRPFLGLVSFLRCFGFSCARWGVRPSLGGRAGHFLVSKNKLTWGQGADGFHRHPRLALCHAPDRTSLSDPDSNGIVFSFFSICYSCLFLFSGTPLAIPLHSCPLSVVCQRNPSHLYPRWPVTYLVSFKTYLAVQGTRLLHLSRRLSTRLEPATAAGSTVLLPSRWEALQLRAGLQQATRKRLRIGALRSGAWRSARPFPPFRFLCDARCSRSSAALVFSLFHSSSVSSPCLCFQDSSGGPGPFFL